MAACAKKIKRKVQENQKTVKKGLHTQMIMDGGESKKLKTCCVVENNKTQKQLREYDEIKENKKKCSPMS